MKNKSFSKKIVIASVAMLIVISTAAASIMSGCGDNSENTTKPAINSTSVTTDSTDETIASTELTTSIEKSEDETKNSETNTEKPNKQDNDKNSTDKNSSDKNTTDKNSSSSSNKDTSSNNKNNSENNNSKTGVATIAGKKYKVGDKVTATYKIKCPEVLVNYEGEVKYDTNILKLTDFKMHKPASNGVIYNNKLPGRIPFNGSEISEGYDYTKSGNFMTVTYEVVGSGNTTPNLLWEVATGFDMTTNTPFAKNNQPTNGLTIDVSYN